jgi:hypothetical protein
MFVHVLILWLQATPSCPPLYVDVDPNKVYNASNMYAFVNHRDTVFMRVEGTNPAEGQIVTSTATGFCNFAPEVFKISGFAHNSIQFECRYDADLDALHWFYRNPADAKLTKANSPPMCSAVCKDQPFARADIDANYTSETVRLHVFVLLHLNVLMILQYWRGDVIGYKCKDGAAEFNLGNNVSKSTFILECSQKDTIDAWWSNDNVVPECSTTIPDVGK